jgi:Fe-Mn family superoxide dismutase
MIQYTLPDLPYAYNALEPYIDEQTMKLHHTKHHQGYLDKFVAAIENTDLANKRIEEIFKEISKHSAAVRNNGGGFYNHGLFWRTMTPNGQKSPSGALADAISNAFGSFDAFKKEFSNAAATRFGSGWAWLVKKDDGKLIVSSTPNQDNPLMDVAEVQGQPLLGLDVWEHAYYLKYQNRRPEYIEAFWNIVNWDEVLRMYGL